MSKSSLVFLFLVALPSIMLGQLSLSGKVLDERHEPLVGAVVVIDKSLMHAVTDFEGGFEFQGLKAESYKLSVSYLGYETHAINYVLSGSAEPLVIVMKVLVLSGPEVVVRASRASKRDPIAYTELRAKELHKINLGMDVPELLQTAPSMTFSSDAGNGIGYTSMRLRGSDQTNINVSINGVPVNDAESQGVFWVNMPDIVASATSIQVQRGVGTSANGAGAFGGSVNLQTQGADQAAFGAIDVGAGSFNTQKLSIAFGTGLLNNHWSLQGRVSSISSDGYVDRSAAELKSYYLAAAFKHKNTQIDILSFGGRELTQQAWWGTPRALLENDQEGMTAFAADNGWSEATTERLLNSDRRFNYYSYDQEVDDYGQDNLQLHLSQKLNSSWKLNAALHYTKGAGFFEQFQDMDNAYDDTSFGDYGLNKPIIGSDTISQAHFIRRRWLDNHFYGTVMSAVYTQSRLQASINLGWNRYEGGHFGELIWASIASNSSIRDRYYDNDAVKEDMNAALKLNYAVHKHWDAYIDLQSRRIDYQYEIPNGRESGEVNSTAHNFFNPKAGFNFVPNANHRAFISYAIGHKEPNRDDFLSADENHQPRAQRLADLELGYAYKTEHVAAEVVLYNMAYTDQLISTGELNDVGEKIRTNVEDSYRRGIELILAARLSRMTWKLNATYSQNIIIDHKTYTPDYITGITLEESHGDVAIAYSPAVIGSSTLGFALVKSEADEQGTKLNFSVISNYVGEQFLDNTETAGRSIDAYMTHDLRLDYRVEPKWSKELRVHVLVRNVLGEVYSSNGWTYRYFLGGQEQSFDALYPQAGTNLMLGASVLF